jgi:hypothetical protein
MKAFGLQREKRGLTLWIPWIRFTVSFGKEPAQAESTNASVPQSRDQNWFEEQMEAIRRGERLHPVMMTSRERHMESARVIKGLDWSKGCADSHGVMAGYEAILGSHLAQAKGCAIKIPFEFTETELRQIIQEEMQLTDGDLNDKVGQK